jgi:dTMP kinase
MAPGKFITLEGGEGAGKSTQAKRLAVFLQERGIKTILTREVGGGRSAEAIRELWLGHGQHNWDTLTELLLICAARREHLTKVVWPNLEKGTWVICDRFLDSTRVYQGVGLGLGIPLVDRFYKLIVGRKFEPDMTLLLDIPVDVGQRRVKWRNLRMDRYEKKEIAFHAKLRRAYLQLAKQYPKRIKKIDAGKSEAEVVSDIQNIIQKYFKISS